ncbi:MAG: hypothetical protein JWO63_714 [Frankiales bacterium]|nr:hypothetical protein [Frankiales bacterium]
MVRIELPTATGSELPEKLQEVERAGALINVFRMLLRSPEIAIPVVALGAAQFAHSSLPSVERELAILTAAACLDSQYEAAQHEPLSRAVGVTDAQRGALAAHHWASPDFDDAQRSLIGLVVGVIESPARGSRLLEVARQHYSDQQLVELVVQTGYYFLLARVASVFDVPIDAPTGDGLLQAGINLASGALS